MTRYAIINVPAYGHVNPTLALAQELVARGAQVDYYVTEEFRASIESTGATFHPYHMPEFGPPAEMPAPQGGPPQMMLIQMLHANTLALPEIIEQLQAERPDCLIYDFMSLSGLLAARILDVPAVKLRPSYVPNSSIGALMARGPFVQGRPPMGAPGQAPTTPPAGAPPMAQGPFSQIKGPEMTAFQQELDRLCARYDIEPVSPQDLWFHHEELNISFIPKEFQPGGENFDKRFVFVGPSIFPRQDAPTFELRKRAEEPVLYISLGTVMNNQPDFFKLCFEAFAHEPWHVVMAHGKRIDLQKLGAVPANFQVAPYLPQLEVLAQSRAFITHGGMNSTMEGLYYGVPLIVVPQQPEQSITAQRVSDIGLGMALKTDELNATILREAVKRVSQDATIRKNVADMQQTIRNSGGAHQAADAIASFSGQPSK
ncbi:glycosyl transferase [Dictyobacter alpinus]|uniref:Glycosyl transferase n=1 Tax=Dictyobacter alpinus TaxID=2014873 RepID=A0A402BC40_9CHLR|nr:macrolide family glycosyltransferase [Dictyobacter alpinus]GCE28847.1 glycosyl transferase [Dictyobacter alpinus]